MIPKGVHQLWLEHAVGGFLGSPVVLHLPNSLRAAQISSTQHYTMFVTEIYL